MPEVVAVDYSANTITVDSALTWSAGLGVGLAAMDLFTQLWMRVRDAVASGDEEADVLVTPTAPGAR